MFGQRGIRSILAHTLSTERSWRSGWRGQGRPAALDEDDFPTVAALAARWRDDETAMRAYLDSLTDADLSGKFHDFTLWHCLAHVVNHGTQHRSEVAMLLTGFGHSPGDLDLVFFVRDRATPGRT